ncbi:MAG: C40 family peptidase [Sulfuritalea sp.]|jgi:cell wall-associated NlpC family hydrolase|nr:C40 family peptidase [Sulfuritalea sp.]
MSASRYSLAALLASSTLVLGACGVLNYGAQSPAPVVSSRVPGGTHSAGAGATAPEAGSGAAASINARANDVVLFALGLIETGYRFGGKNPEAGLDCSGMVSYVFRKSVDMRLAGSAADLARQGKPVPSAQLRPGDLVFFNTLNRPYSHVGIYIGDDRFVHAPNSRGKVRTESLRSGWFAAHFEEGRTYFD